MASEPIEAVANAVGPKARAAGCLMGRSRELDCPIRFIDITFVNQNQSFDRNNPTQGSD
jgi:hypothetical protein